MGTFLEFVTMNFWVLLLILVMLGMKRQHRIGGMVLLVVMTIWGFIPWVIIVVAGLCIVMEFIRYCMLGEWDTPTKKKPQGKRHDPEEYRR